MKYKADLEINLPRNRVIELFNSSENLKKWQKGLISFDHVSGEPGKPGAKSKLKYIMGKREIEMIETVTVNNLPDEFSSTYEAKNVWNEVKNYFDKLGDNTTLWRTENEFRFKGFMKLLALFIPGAFKKQTCSHMDEFKAFAESKA